MVSKPPIDLLKCTHKAFSIFFFLALLFYVVLLWESEVNGRMFYILFWKCWGLQSLWCVPEATITMWTSSQETSVSCFHEFPSSSSLWGVELPCAISPIMQINKTRILGNWGANSWFHARSHQHQLKCRFTFSSYLFSRWAVVLSVSWRVCFVLVLGFVVFGVFFLSLAATCLSTVWYSHQSQEVWRWVSRCVTLWSCSQRSQDEAQ